MNRNVTVVPVDNLIIVDYEPLVFSFQADEDIHAIQWSGGLCKGHIETHSQPVPVYFDTEEAYEEHVAPFVTLWENHKTWLQAEQERLQAEAEANQEEPVAINE